MLGLNRGNGCGNYKYHRACYRLLERGGYNLKVSCDFLEMTNCFRELVYICELERVVKLRECGCYYSYFSLTDVEKRSIYWLNKSYTIDKFL